MLYCTTSISLEDRSKHQAWTKGDGWNPHPTAWDRSPCCWVEGVDGGQHAAKWRILPGAEIPRVHLILKAFQGWVDRQTGAPSSYQTGGVAGDGSSTFIRTLLVLSSSLTPPSAQVLFCSQGEMIVTFQHHALPCGLMQPGGLDITVSFQGSIQMS